MRPMALVTAVLLLPLAAAAADPAEEQLEGYAEWRDGDVLIVDGQRLRLAKDGRFDGERDAKSFVSVPLGYEITARGARGQDGAVAARQVEAKPNGVAMFEKRVRELTDEAEADYQRAGRFYQKARGHVKVVGRLRDSGNEVDRVRHMVDRLAPPYLRPEDVRVYVIENKEWNAFAMGNYSVYAFSGLLRDLDDDELAIVLGHELAHATHEHTRRQFKKAMWVQLAALGMTAASDNIDGRNKRKLAGVLAAFTLLAWKNGYGRDLEDQADRVGLRYAYEAGYDVRRGPELWRRFAKKYGERGAVVNFFFGDHSQASARAANLERELALNYREGPKAARAPAFRRLESEQDDEEEAPAKESALGRSGEIRRGMGTWEVRRLLGRPDRELTFGQRRKWTYPDCTVIFEDGRVVEVRF